MRKSVVAALLALVPLVGWTPGARAEIAGRVAVLDATTIEIGARPIRLWGIAAPGSARQCRGADGVIRPCRQQAALALAEWVGTRRIRCQEGAPEADGRSPAICWAGAEQLNGWMVANGWAHADARNAVDYVGLEDTARQRGSGMWGPASLPAPDFRRPDWRSAREPAWPRYERREVYPPLEPPRYGAPYDRGLSPAPPWGPTER